MPTDSPPADSDPVDVEDVSRQARPVIDELLANRTKALRTPLLYSQFCHGLRRLGIPLDRSNLHMPQLHPQILARSFLWLADSGGAIETGRRHGLETEKFYLDSPIRRIYEGASIIRRRIEDPEAPREFPILEDLAQQGYTDYCLLPLAFSTGGRPNALGFATKREGGLSALDMAFIDEVLPAFGAVLELRHQRQTAETLLTTYVGRSTGERVLSGAIKRGDGEIINAVLWYCDLRSYTTLSETLDSQSIIALLNDYFEVMAQPVKGRGGEILKFIGDAMLAIFPLSNSEDGIAETCARAMLAAEEALDGISAFNELRSTKGLQPIRAGVSLARGPVMYGNIGDVERLDFTVIGPAVNLATRLEDLTRDLDPPIVFSKEVAEYNGRSNRSLGHHSLKGIAQPQEAFTLC